jgi:ribonuclease E
VETLVPIPPLCGRGLSTAPGGREAYDVSENDENTPAQEPEQGTEAAPRRRRRAASRPAGPPPVPTAAELAAAAAVISSGPRRRDPDAAEPGAGEQAAPDEGLPDLDDTQAVEDDETDEGGAVGGGALSSSTPDPGPAAADASPQAAPADGVDAPAPVADRADETVGQSPTITDELAGTDRPTPTSETLPPPVEIADAVEPADAETSEVERVEQSRPARRRRRATSRDALAGVAALAGETSPGPVQSEDTDAGAPDDAAADEAVEAAEPTPMRSRRRRGAPPVVTFQQPEIVAVPRAQQLADDDDAEADLGESLDDAATGESDPDAAASEAAPGDEDDAAGGTRRRRRGRRGRGRIRDESAADAADAAGTESAAGSRRQAPAESDRQVDLVSDETNDEPTDESEDGTGTTRRRRRRRRGGAGDADGAATELAPDDPPNTVVHVREPRSADSAVRGLTGSTRLEAKRQRRREGRDQGRRRVPIATEAEFLARREAVERTMVVRNVGERTQIAVLEDGVLVEHYVTRASSSAYAGNVYLGRVQNVLPGMEAAFVDIGKGRNGVLYAGEVNYDASGLEGKPRKIEQALKSGQAVTVQVTKDPIGQKGARLTSQVSLPGRYMVYVPEGGSAGISRKLPDTERTRLRGILKQITPEDAGVIVRTAAEGATEEELGNDIARLAAQWESIQKKAAKAAAPALLYAEPDLVIRVVRDVFNEDFAELVVQGEDEWAQIEQYVASVAPDLMPRVRKHVAVEDVFTALRIDEQLLKALDRKVYLPSGGSLVFDRTEAMTVVDVNTGRFTGKGTSNLEETVTRNNLEAAEELVRQLRLRDVGGMIVVDFIDMVLESNRELVLRRLTECLGRDRTKHQVAEVTSLGLVQMTRKRVGQGLFEAYAEPCPTCGGQGVTIELPAPKARPIPRPPAMPPRRPDEIAAGSGSDAPERAAAGDLVVDAGQTVDAGPTTEPDTGDEVDPADLTFAEANDPGSADAVMEGGAVLPEHAERVEVEVEAGGAGPEPDDETARQPLDEAPEQADQAPEQEAQDPVAAPRARRTGRRRASAPAGAPAAALATVQPDTGTETETETETQTETETDSAESEAEQDQAVTIGG